MLKVLKSGFYTSVQDDGRDGFREYGVPVSGVMDAYSSQFANAILGNSDNAAVLEMTMTGGSFQFLEPTWIAISGAEMNPQLNSNVITQNSIIRIESNDILSFGKVTKGFRTYLAIKDGFKTEAILGSRSQYQPITKANVVGKGDLLKYSRYNRGLQKMNASVKFDDSLFSSDELEVFKGPEFDRLSSVQKEILINEALKVSKLNSRMAYQLEPLVKNDLKPILTSPVLPGTVQLTPSGNLIVLMRECQTTGGYTRVLQLTERAINILSQKSTGNWLKIRLKGF